MSIHQPIPTQFQKDGKQYADGFLTPKNHDSLQVASFAPERVIPVIFLPGIMGSNLRMTAKRQTQLKKKNNMAWHPDDALESLAMGGKTPAERQLQLDPNTTVVDIYAPQTNPTGNPKESADDRHGNAKPVATAQTPLMMDDPCTKPSARKATLKARERGWGEVFFGSYGDLLNHLETRLNLAFSEGKLNPEWKDIINIAPSKWQSADKSTLEPLTEQDLKKIVTNCFYPVHAFGYNWLQSNGVGAKEIAKRINNLVDNYRKKHFMCEKVIIVTHSMGGLVGRALCHPDYGNLQDKILGIVHGVMPAMGSAAAYRRMRAGFEGGGIGDWVIGNEGTEVTAVLGNAPGGLQLLPSDAYGNDWLRIATKNGKVLKSLPKQGDPYTEIYSKTDVWWGLLREEWINPAGDIKGGIEQTKEYLLIAKEFHQKINTTYHPLSYAHYGCDPKRKAFQNVIWEVSDRLPIDKLDSLRIANDNLQGTVQLAAPADNAMAASHHLYMGVPDSRFEMRYRAQIKPPADPGDQTVPMHSADHQLKSGKFSGIFRQTGYEHQDSYKDDHAVASTLYSIVQIARQMAWPS